MSDQIEPMFRLVVKDIVGAFLIVEANKVDQILSDGNINLIKGEIEHTIKEALRENEVVVTIETRKRKKDL